jgi:hypothetical protein
MKYLTIELTVALTRDMDAEKIMELLQDSMTNMPVNNLIGKDGKLLGKIQLERVTDWPKDPL